MLSVFMSGPLVLPLHSIQVFLQLQSSNASVSDPKHLHGFPHPSKHRFTERPARTEGCLHQTAQLLHSILLIEPKAEAPIH